MHPIRRQHPPVFYSLQKLTCEYNTRRHETDPLSSSRQAVMSGKASLQSKTFAEGGGSTWALRGGGGGPGVPEGMGGVCEGTGGVGTMGGGVWEGPWSAPCAAINAMSCTDWSPAEHIPAINI